MPNISFATKGGEIKAEFGSGRPELVLVFSLCALGQVALAFNFLVSSFTKRRDSNSNCSVSLWQC